MIITKHFTSSENLSSFRNVCVLFGTFPMEMPIAISSIANIAVESRNKFYMRHNELESQLSTMSEYQQGLLCQMTKNPTFSTKTFDHCLMPVRKHHHFTPNSILDQAQSTREPAQFHERISGRITVKTP